MAIDFEGVALQELTLLQLAAGFGLNRSGEYDVSKEIAQRTSLLEAGGVELISDPEFAEGLGGPLTDAILAALESDDDDEAEEAAGVVETGGTHDEDDDVIELEFDEDEGGVIETGGRRRRSRRRRVKRRVPRSRFRSFARKFRKQRRRKSVSRPRVSRVVRRRQKKSGLARVPRFNTTQSVPFFAVLPGSGGSFVQNDGPYAEESVGEYQVSDVADSIVSFGRNLPYRNEAAPAQVSAGAPLIFNLGTNNLSTGQTSTMHAAFMNLYASVLDTNLGHALSISWSGATVDSPAAEDGTTSNPFTGLITLKKASSCIIMMTPYHLVRARPYPVPLRLANQWTPNGAVAPINVQAQYTVSNVPINTSVYVHTPGFAADRLHTTFGRSGRR